MFVIDNLDWIKEGTDYKKKHRNNYKIKRLV